jgi:hypothetical protein
VYFVLEKRDNNRAISFTPRIFKVREDAISFVKHSKKALEIEGITEVNYFIFKGISIS